MIRAFLAGLIAGVIAFIIQFIFGPIGIFLGLFPMPPISGLAISLVIFIIFGIVFGMIFSKLYNCIPGKGPIKGLYFAMIIWLVEIFEGAFIAVLTEAFSITSMMVFVGFFTLATYGLVLGYLYKK